MGYLRPLFLDFRLLVVNKSSIKFLLLTWFIPRNSWVGRNRSTNWATTICILLHSVYFLSFQLKTEIKTFDLQINLLPTQLATTNAVKRLNRPIKIFRNFILYSPNWAALTFNSLRLISCTTLADRRGEIIPFCGKNENPKLVVWDEKRKVVDLSKTSNWRFDNFIFLL